MIPLMYVLPTDAVYTPASGVVTKITPSYSHYRDSIQVEFKYNLDEYFYLEIGLNEFDQPSAVSLYGFYNSHTIEMNDLISDYHLIGKKVSIILTKEVILEIANNLVTPASFQEGSEIEFSIIQDKQAVSERAIISKIEILPMSVELTIDAVDMVYAIGTKSTSFQPTLAYGGQTHVPDAVDGYYNIFTLEGVNAGKSLVIIPPQDFENHYIFRQNESLKSLAIAPSGAVSIKGTEYFYNNGLMDYFGLTMSMQFFLIYDKDEDYKTYIFNAARDKNLYSEISLLFPAVQHNSMTIYDLEENVLIKGQVNYFGEIDSETDKLLYCVSMTKCKDFFGRDVDKTYKFKFLPSKILSEDIKRIKNAAKVGTVYVTDNATGEVDVIPMDAKDINFQKEGYLTASNNKYSVSLKKKTLIHKSELMRGNFKNFKAITGGDFMSPLYRFDTIDFESNTITVRNGTMLITRDLRDKDVLVVSTGSSRLDAQEHMSDFAGIELPISPTSITTSGINITNFSDYVMLCRMVEESTYGIAGVRRDTKDLLYSLTLSFLDTDITVIYNIRADKLYYINFAKKETVTSHIDMPYVFSKYMSSIDEVKLKAFLQYGSISTFKAYTTANSSYVSMVNDELFSEEVIHEKYLDDNHNITSMMSSSLGLTSFEHLAYSAGVQGAYIPRPGEIDVMKTNFGRNISIYRKAMTGVYANKDIDIVSASIIDSMFTITFIHDDETHTTSISLQGGPTEIRKGIKKSIFSDAVDFTYMSACTYDSTVSYDNLYQSYSMLVAEASLDVGMAFDLNVLELMSSKQTLGVNNTLLISYGNRMFMTSGALSNTVTVSGDIITCGDVVLNTTAPTGEAKALSFNGENGDISTTISNEEYDKLLSEWPTTGLDDNGFMPIDEFASSEAYSISFDITKAQYLQFKE